jgi:ankyrin repeat protein
VQIDAEVLSWAAGAGHIAMCQYLLSIGCDWHSSACKSAAGHGQLDTLRWLQENGCPWIVSDVCMIAAAYGFSDIFDYIIEQGEMLNAELLTNALSTADAGNNLQAVQWLRQRGAQWPAVLMDDRFYHGVQWSGESLARALAEGCTSPVTL